MLKIIPKSNFKIIFIIIFVICIVFYLYKTKNSFDIRISIKEENFSSENMDNIFAINLTKEFLNLKSIKNCTTVSSQNYSNIYLKYNFLFNKTDLIQKTKIILDDFISKTKLNPEIDFDFEYDKKYDYFLILYNQNNDISNLCENFDKLKTKLINSKIISKIFDFQEFETVNTIFFKNSDLLNYDITPSEIKNIIQQNNVLVDSVQKEDKYLYFINFNSNIKNMDDIGNIPLYYKDKNFSIEFKKVFELKKENSLAQEYGVYFNNKKVKLLALKKNKLLSSIIFEFLIKNKLKSIDFDDFISYKLFNTSNFSKTTIYLEQHSIQNDLVKIIELLSKNFENQLYFLGYDNPKISQNDIFREFENNKIVILSLKNKKLKNFLKKNNINFDKIPLTTKKENILVYDYNNMDLNGYFFSKEELTQNLIANNEGLICDYYFNNTKRTKIILKNKEKTDFVYSKKFKSLLDTKMLLKKELKEKPVIIVRKNGKII